ISSCISNNCSTCSDARRTRAAALGRPWLLSTGATTSRGGEENRGGARGCVSSRSRFDSELARDRPIHRGRNHVDRFRRGTADFGSQHDPLDEPANGISWRSAVDGRQRAPLGRRRGSSPCARMWNLQSSTDGTWQPCLYAARPAVWSLSLEHALPNQSQWS